MNSGFAKRSKKNNPAFPHTIHSMYSLVISKKQSLMMIQWSVGGVKDIKSKKKPKENPNWKPNLKP